MKISYFDSEDIASRSTQLERKQSEPKFADTPTPMKKLKQSTSHSEDVILGEKTKLVWTRTSFRQNEEMLQQLVFIIESTSFNESLPNLEALNLHFGEGWGKKIGKSECPSQNPLENFCHPDSEWY